MRLKSLIVRKFKNLHDFHVDFSQSSFITVLVGRNGTGKSNLLEVLTVIFRDLDLGEAPEFAYQLTYMYSDVEVRTCLASKLGRARPWTRCSRVW